MGQATKQPLTKSCRLCGKTQPFDEFYKRPNSSDGRCNQCKTCHRAKSRAWSAANKERKAASHKRWSEENKDRKREYMRRWEKENPERAAMHRKLHRERHPDKTLARRAISHGVRDGKVIKPDACQACGKVTKSRSLHAHHEDYSKPFDIEWLCRDCHFKIHREDG